MVDLVIVLQTYYFLIFYCYTIILNVKSLINFCICSGDIYLSSGISLSFAFVIVSKLFYGELLENFEILAP